MPDVSRRGGGERLTRLRPNHLWKLGAVLLGIVLMQILVISIGDSRFGSGSDAGGRLAAVAAASENGSCDHDLGYWAADVDPSANFHPLTRTDQTGNAYVQPTDILFVCASSAASKALGLPFALAVPLSGVLLAAVGAWMFDRDSGGGGWPGAAVVGLLGPVAFYGADLWEHAPATGAAVLGTALLLTRISVSSAIAGGALWGLAVSFRLETGIVAMALGLALVLSLEGRRRLLRSWPRTTGFALAGAGVLALDRSIERSVFASAFRDERVVGGAGGSGQVSQGGAELSQRLRDVLVTNIGVLANDADTAAFAIGVLFVASAAVLALCLTGTVVSRRLRLAAILVLTLVVALRVADPGFVPGMFVAAPVAVLGAVRCLRRSDSSDVTIVLGRAGLLSMPVIWYFQWTGSLSAQWGGRYQLLVAAFLTIAAFPVLVTSLPLAPMRVLLGATAVLALSGAWWHVERTNEIAKTFDELAEIECPGRALLSTHEFLLREGGGTPQIQAQAFGACHLLSSSVVEDRAGLRVFADLGRTRATVLYRGHVEIGSDRLSPWIIEDTSLIEAGPIPLTVVQVRLP